MNRPNYQIFPFFLLRRRFESLSNHNGDVAACLLLLGVNVLVYHPMLQAILSHLGDLLVIARVQEGVVDSLQSAFLYDGSPAYRPLQNLIFAVEFKVFGYDGLGFQVIALGSWIILLFLLYALIRRLGASMPVTLLVLALTSFTRPVYTSIWHAQIPERLEGIIFVLILHFCFSSSSSLQRLPSCAWGVIFFLLFGIALAAKEFGIALVGTFLVAAWFQPVIARGSLDGLRILRWPLFIAAIASLAIYFTIRIVLDDVSAFGPDLQLTTAITNVSIFFVQPVLPLFDSHGQVVLGQLGLGWALNAILSMMILPLGVLPVVWVLFPSSPWLIRYNHSPVIPFVLLVFGLSVLFSAVLSSGWDVSGYQAGFVSQLLWAILVSLGLALVWKSGRRSLVTITIAAILVLTIFSARNAWLEAQNYRDYTLQGEWVTGSAVSENPNEYLPKDLRSEIAAYYCEGNPNIKCP